MPHAVFNPWAILRIMQETAKIPALPSELSHGAGPPSVVKDRFPGKEFLSTEIFSLLLADGFRVRTN